MQFPIYQVPFLGNGMVIGFNATVHVLISHGIPIGLLGMIFLADWMTLIAHRPVPAEWEAHKKRLLRFALLAATTIGPLTGVGIWFTTTALAPRAIASMLRIFFWPWFIEWIVFVLELLALLAYYFLWDKLAGKRQKTRVLAGALYMALSIFTAVLITGILGFMLTPGNWPEQRSFWQAFLNPTYLPQLLYRLGLAFFLGALIACAFLLFDRRNAVIQRQAMGLYGTILLGSVTAMVLSLAWYFAMVPKAYSINASFSVLTSRLSQSPQLFAAANLAAFLIFFLAAIVVWLRRPTAARWLVVPALLFTFALAAEFERIREFIRGPYLLPGYMHANSVLLEEHPHLSREGFLKNDFWFQTAMSKDSPDAAGARLFAQNCSACHTLSGINSIRRRASGRSEDGLFVLIGRTHELTSFMPPFSGTPEEKRQLARFLFRLTNNSAGVSSYSRLLPADAETTKAAQAEGVGQLGNLSTRPTELEKRPTGNEQGS